MLDHFHDSLWVIPFSVFVGGLIGSPHCMAMCGPLVLNFSSERSRLWAYQGGRMLSYTTVGAIIGAVGNTFLGPTRPVWLAATSLAFIAVLLFLNGYRAWKGHSLHFPLKLKTPKVIDSFSRFLWTQLRLSQLPPVVTAGAAGVLTVFLPCGHLYSFLIGAVATGSALKGAGFMFAFWLGSTPLLSFGAVWLHRLFDSKNHPKNKSRQRFAGALLVIAGLTSVLAFAARIENFSSEHAHHESLVPGSVMDPSEDCHH